MARRLRSAGETYPCESDESAPDETVLALFPYGHAERGISGEPVDPYEDVRGRKPEAESSERMRGRMRICGHLENEKDLFDF